MISLEDVQRARAAIAGGVAHTPSAVSRTLSSLVGATVILKFENLQFTASFKERGALNRLLALSPDARRAGVVAMSAGNHAQGVAYHAHRLGIPATIVMPEHTPSVKVSRTRVHGAHVILRGANIAACEAEARRIEVEQGLTFIHPFDDPLIIAGQGTVALEMLEDHPSLDTIVVPVGGGGLISGMAIATKALAPGVSMIGVQTERYPSMTGGGTGGATIAEGIAVGAPGALTRPIVRDLVDDIVLVSEAAIEEAVGVLIEVEKTVAEGAGAAGLAAVLTNPERFAGRTVGVVLTGGNIDPRLLASVLLRGLVRAGQLVTLQVELTDHPGSLAQIATIVAAEGANIVDVRHSRLLTQLSIRSAQVELVIEVTEPAQAAAAMRRLREAGFATEHVDPQS